jgi:hypothetical protein
MRRTASTMDIEQLFRPKAVGEPVNMHVVQQAIEPEPDFEAMRRLIQGDDDEETARDEPEKREIPQNR